MSLSFVKNDLVYPKTKRNLQPKSNQELSLEMQRIRQEGLSKPIASENKGFSILAKMGFKMDGPEPIPLTVKTDRSGLGSKKEPVPPAASDVSDFIARQGLKYDSRKLARDLSNARSACQTLDENNSLEETEFWPSDDPTEFNSLEPFVQLIAVNDYLRSNYCYCTWCKCRYENAEMLQSECPGDTSQDHDD